MKTGNVVYVEVLNKSLASIRCLINKQLKLGLSHDENHLKDHFSAKEVQGPP